MYTWSNLWNAAKGEEAPWWQDVSMHAFRTGIHSATEGLKNFSESKAGKRAGPRVKFPKFKSKNKSKLSVSFTELNHQLSWLHEGRHGIRLMLPRASGDLEVRRRRRELEWMHTVQSTRKLYKLVESGQAAIQNVTVSKTGGRWQASFLVRYATAQPVKSVPYHGGAIGVDLGVKHLATLSRPVPGLTDAQGHIANPRVLERELHRLRRLDRAIARCVKGSKNRRKLLARRARLHGRIVKTRAMHLHRITNALAAGFDVVAIEDLNVKGMANRKRHLGRRLNDAGLGETRRQLVYKTSDRTATLVVVDRFYPSSKTCSSCGTVKAKLCLHERVFVCDTCGVRLDRDVNAARNIEREALRLLTLEQDQELELEQAVAGLRPETSNADLRTGETQSVHAAGHGSFESRTKQPTRPPLVVLV
jgi:putative transposase